MATLPRPMPGGPAGPAGPPGAPGGPGVPGPMGGPMMQQALQSLVGQLPANDPMAAMRSLTQMPQPDNVEVAIRRAQEILGYAMGQIHARSPEVAKEIASGLMNLKQAQQKLQALPRPEIPMPPAGLPMAGPMLGGLPPGAAPAMTD